MRRSGKPRPDGSAGKGGRPAKGGQPGGKGGAARTVGGDQVEGRQAVLELLLTGARPVREVWISQEVGEAAILDDIRELAADGNVPVRDVSQGKFMARARCEAPQGVLAGAAELPELTVEELLEGRQLPSHAARPRPAASGAAPFLVALDSVTDPGNLGAVLRSAECAGASGAVLPRHRAVHVTPAVTKAAAGAVEHLPVALVGGLPSAIATLREQDVLVVGLDGEADGSIYDLPPVDSAVCLVFGAEGRGLSHLVRRRCDVLARIPLYGRMAALNISAAGALACYEVARRRAAAG